MRIKSGRVEIEKIGQYIYIYIYIYIVEKTGVAQGESDIKQWIITFYQGVYSQSK